MKTFWKKKEKNKMFLFDKDNIKDPDPTDLTVDNAYKTRWVWYHTFMALELLIIIILLIGILIKI